MITPHTNAQTASPIDTLPTAIAAIAVRSSTSEVASLSRLSPSSIVTTRGAIPSLFTIDVATASVGLSSAPRAIARYRSIPGMTSTKKSASAAVLTSTSRIDRPAIGRKSRRNSIAGSETADEYSRGGRTPTRMISGSTSNAGKNGSRLTPIPIATRARGPAIPTRGASAVARATTTTPMTATTRASIASTAPRAP